LSQITRNGQIVLQERITPRGQAAMTGLSRSLSTLGLTLGLSLTALAQTTGQPQQLPMTQLRAGMHLIQAEVARTPQEHAIGLMWRKEMPTNHGMIFAFPKAGVQCFWMKNTLLPLSVAFIDDNGRVVNIDEMKPQTEDSHCSAEPVRFVLEMNSGWFQKRGIKAGSKIEGAPFDSR
jgi:uncharacterized membrane protein (UPF0127 family)